MATSRDEFIALVSRLEQVSKAEPSVYRFRLGLLALLGYAYIVALLLLALGIIVVVVQSMIATGHISSWELKLLILPVIVVLAIVQSLWVRVPLPEGISIRRDEAPYLFQLIDTLSAQLKAPRIHHVLFCNDFNAAVAQIPRLGFFGWYRNYLMLGYPLMQSCTPEQFRAVLAHEMGHLSKQHSRFSVWIWRLRETWGRLINSLAESHGAWLFNWFLRWYGPYFMAYSFVLARADEYEADRHAKQLTSARIMAEGLVTLCVRDKFLDQEYWSTFSHQVQEDAIPPSDPYNRLAEIIRLPIPLEDARKWLALAVARQTDYNDSHPALSERLAALGFTEVLTTPGAMEAFLPGVVTRSAAEEFIGASLPRYIAQLNNEWVKHITPVWQQKYQEALQSKARLQELSSRVAQGETLGKEESWERAKLLAELQGTSEAKPLLLTLLASWPDFAPARYALGQTLLESDDESGISYIQQAMSEDQDFILPGCQLLVGYYKERGRTEEAEPYINRSLQQMETLEQADRMAARISKNDVYEPAQLPAVVLQSIQALVEQDKEVQYAYLVRKLIPSQPKRVVHLLALKTNLKGFVFDEEASLTKLVQRIAEGLTMSEDIFVILLHKNQQRQLENKLKTVPNSLLGGKK